MASEYSAAAHSGWPPAPARDGGRLRRGWTIVTTLLLAIVFAEAVFAGAMLSGEGWARAAHRIDAMIAIIAIVATGLVALATLRRVSHGPRLGWTLLAAAAVVFLQAVLGALAAKGANLLWVHVPLGVALVGLAGQVVAAARRLGQP
jgi:hypothetical protein